VRFPVSLSESVVVVTPVVVLGCSRDKESQGDDSEEASGLHCKIANG
jgi:hypothetical protein